MPLRGVVAAKGVIANIGPLAYLGVPGNAGKVSVEWWNFEKSLIWRKFSIEEDAYAEEAVPSPMLHACSVSAGPG